MCANHNANVLLKKEFARNRNAIYQYIRNIGFHQEDNTCAYRESRVCSSYSIRTLREVHTYTIKN